MKSELYKSLLNMKSKVTISMKIRVMITLHNLNLKIPSICSSLHRVLGIQPNNWAIQMS